MSSFTSQPHVSSSYFGETQKPKLPFSDLKKLLIYITKSSCAGHVVLVRFFLF